MFGFGIMANYDYKCTVCGGVQEISKPMGSDWAPSCCQTVMTQVYSAVPVKFNASGFYSTGG
jgi:predicted nucleic acid-binding Zn ribbon protein